SNHRADRFAAVHEIESVVDLLERHDVRDEIVDVDPLVHVPVDDLRHIRPPACAPKRRALPNPSGDQLEGARLDLLARAGDADNDRHAPAAMAALERLAHQIDVADALEAVIGAAVGEGHDVLHQVTRDFLGIHEVRHAELLPERLTRRIDVDADDFVRPGEPRTLDDVEADAPQAKHHHIRAGLDLFRFDDRAYPRGY